MQNLINDLKDVNGGFMMALRKCVGEIRWYILVWGVIIAAMFSFYPDSKFWGMLADGMVAHILFGGVAFLLWHYLPQAVKDDNSVDTNRPFVSALGFLLIINPLFDFNGVGALIFNCVIGVALVWFGHKLYKDKHESNE